MSDLFNFDDSQVVKPILFKLTTKNENPATEGRHYAGLKRIPSEDTIFVDGKSRTIRYSVGEESIYRDEQPAHVELTDIIFTNGSLRVYEDNPTLLEFLRACNWNRDNKSRVRGKRVLFYEHNPQAVAAEKMKQEELEIEARYKAKHMPFGELRSLARALKLNVDRYEEEIRHDMLVFAKTKPLKFMEALSSPMTARRAEVMDVVELGIIEIQQRGVFMETATGNKEQIHVVPVGGDPTDSFVEFTLTKKEGEEVWKEIAKKKRKLIE